MKIRSVRIGIASTSCAIMVCLGSTLSASAESVQKICGDEWSEAKKSGKVPAGQAWPGFLSECRKRHAADATSPAKPTPAGAPTTPVKSEKPAAPIAPAAAAAKPAAAAAAKPAAAAAAAKPAAGAAENPTEACRAEYDAGKKSGAVPKGTNYFRFLSDCRKKRAGGGTTPAAAAAAAAVPATVSAPAAKTTTAAPPAVPSRSAAKPTAGAGREAFVERERQCGARWKAIKGSSALPAGVTTWPKYLSYCNARLKQNLPI